MSGASRLTDLWSGICCCHDNPTCIPMSGKIIKGSKDIESSNLGQARLTDLTQGWCGHTGKIVTGSSNVLANGLGSARVGDQVTGCNIGRLITGNPTHIIN
jgi:uncharacterized Zn-binding protein involved in type VI secretion